MNSSPDTSPSADKKGSPNTSRADSDLGELIGQLDQDRAWLLQQIDLGRWADLRLDLAALERELGQLLAKAAERLESDGSRS